MTEKWLDGLSSRARVLCVIGGTLLYLAAVGLLAMLLVACVVETPTPSPVMTPTPPASPLPAPIEAEAIGPVTTSYKLSWQDDEGLTMAYNLMDVFEQISDTVTSWAIYSYRADWKIIQDGGIVAMGAVTSTELEAATEMGSDEYNGPVEIKIPTDRFSGTAELWVKGCWYPDASGWPVLCSTRMFTDTGPPDADGYLFGQYVEGLPQAIYLPYVVKQFCPPCP